MAKSATLNLDNFITSWNTEFPDYQLTVEDLKKPLSVMGALFQLFDRLGIDRDAVLMPPNETKLNEHMKYYWDLIPVINVTRVVNHLISVMPQVATISVNHFLQPTAQTSHSILLLMFNLIWFNEERLRDIAPYEEELFNVANTVKELEDKKNKLLEKLNVQAEEKAKRGERMAQMQREIQQLEEELQSEELLRDQEQQELEALLQENKEREILIDQKRATKEGLIAERERKRALRVYDAEEIKAQAEQAAQSLQEAEEKLNSQKAIMTQKENSLKILQSIKPNLDTANNLLDDISKLKDLEVGDLDEDSKDGELEVLTTELGELRAQEADLIARRDEAASRRHQDHDKWQQEKIIAETALKDAEAEDKKNREFVAKANQRMQEIQDKTISYKEQKSKGLEAIEDIKKNYNEAIKTWEEALCKLVSDVKVEIENKQRGSNSSSSSA